MAELPPIRTVADQHLVQAPPSAAAAAADFRLSTFPSACSSVRYARRQVRGSLQFVETLPVRTKRIMFSTMRSHEKKLDPDLVMLEAGVSIGELSTAQLMFCTHRFSRRPRNSK